ncbi:MAG: aldehyde dehydrogenase family protein [Candidatus Cloacimonadota bacterium]|nr:MAG: aldehyde dehydrogenase family protein [Candidatus Cloacimonadota bacterium]
MDEKIIEGKMFINGKWKPGKNYFDVVNPFTDEVIGRIPTADDKDIENTIDAAVSAFQISKSLTAYERARLLEEVSKKIDENQKELSKLISLESGKPIRYALGEVKRAVETFKFASIEAKEIYGEVIPMDAAERGKDYFGFYIRVPKGVILAITPFNFPLNLVAHKVAPAIASGNSVILKPASVTPLISLKLIDIFENAGLPQGVLNILFGAGSEVGMKLVKDDRINMVTFTGSLAVGETIKREAGFKTVTLELGSNSAVVVEDVEDLPGVVDRLIVGAFAYSGQVCISVQRIYVNRKLFDDFLTLFVEKTKKLKLGNPLNPETDIGPMITTSETTRAMEWLEEAKSKGAKVLTGGKNEGNIIFPTVLTNVSKEMRVIKDEVFAPVVSIVPYDNFDEALKLADETKYGLQAGVYTKDVNKIFKAVDTINVGGLILNDFPTFRVDHMPYGGVKKSGMGREGLKYAVEEMTEIKLVVIKRQKR